MGKKTKLFLTVKCQLINVEETMALKYNHFSILIEITDSGKNHWMVEQVDEILRRNRTCIVSKSLPTKYCNWEKNNFIMERPGRLNPNQVIQFIMSERTNKYPGLPYMIH